MPLPSGLKSFCQKNLLRNLRCLCISCFSLVVFTIVSLPLNFTILIIMCLDVYLCSFILFGILWASWVWVYFLPQIRDVFSYNSLNKFYALFSLLLGSATMQMLLPLCCPIDLSNYLHFTFFSFCCSFWLISHFLSFRAL